MDIEEYEDIFTRVAIEYGLDKHLLAEQAWRESRWDPLAIGQADDMGIMQILPDTWMEWAPKVGVFDPFDPESNIRVGAAYLQYLRQYLGKRLHLTGDQWVLVAYNWGPGNVRRLIEAGKGWTDIPKKRRNYALDILIGAEARALAAAERI